jgi:hypothetical protein
MTIPFRCAECDTAYEVDDELSGKAIRCRECHGLNRVSLPAKKPDPDPAKKPDPLPTKKPESAPPPSSPFAISYRCPFCNSDKPPIWRNYWTPVSTLVCFFVLAPFFLFIFGCGLNAFIGPLLMAAIHAESDRGTVINTTWIAALGGLLFCGELAAFYFLSGSRFVREARQVCPDCDVRIS